MRLFLKNNPQLSHQDLQVMKGSTDESNKLQLEIRFKFNQSKKLLQQWGTLLDLGNLKTSQWILSEYLLVRKT